MDGINNFITSHNLGDLASIFSLIIVTVGFTLTKNAVSKARKDIIRNDISFELSKAISSMNEIKRLHRLPIENTLPVLLDRYSSLKDSLIRIQSSLSDFHIRSYWGLIEKNDRQIEQMDRHKTVLTDAITHFRRIENLFEEAASDGSGINESRIYRTLSRQADKLHVVLLDIKNQIGR